MEDRVFLQVLFLTGARISEVVKLLKGSDFSINKEGVVFVHLTTLKRRGEFKNMPRLVPIVSSEKYALEVFNYALAHRGVLFPFSRMTGWRIVKRYFKDAFPHYFRHARSTLLLRDFETFGLNDLKTYHNWGSLTMAKYYVHSNVKDVVRKMK